MDYGYQRHLYEVFAPFRGETPGLNYPPHHSGRHLEEYFCHRFAEERPNVDRYLIPIHWSAVYRRLDTTHEANLQSALESLDRTPPYFTVSTYDEGPSGPLPDNIINFAAGGDSNHIYVPIPLACDPHPDVKDCQKDIFCSFVGAITCPLREQMVEHLANLPGYVIRTSNWTPRVPSDRAQMFRHLTERSRFCLCPRGNGLSSFRLYESMQLGAIPVYISDRHMLPWQEELDWRQFCIIVRSEDLPHLHARLKAITATQVRRMQDRLAEVWQCFGIPQTFERIIAKHRMSDC